MIRLELKIKDEFKVVDIDQNTSLSITQTQSDLTNPTAVKIPFSFQVSLPKTRTNSDIFAHIGIRSTSRLFDPLELINFRLYVNESLYQSGYINLEQVDIEPDGYYYIRLYGGLGYFFSKMADIPLNYLDINCDHEINQNTLKDLIENDNGVFGYAMTYQGKYPQFDEGKKDDNGIINDATWTGTIGQRGNTDLDENRRSELIYNAEYRSYYQKPTLRLRAIFDAIIAKAESEGFTVNLDDVFFSDDNPYYDKTWLLCNNVEVGEVAGAYGFSVSEFGDTGTLRENSEYKIKSNDARDLGNEKIEPIEFVSQTDSSNIDCPVVIAEGIQLKKGDRLTVSFHTSMLATFYDNSNDDQIVRTKKASLNCNLELYNSETKNKIRTGILENKGADDWVEGRIFNDNNVQGKRPSNRNSSYFGEQNFFYDVEPNYLNSPDHTINGDTNWKYRMAYEATEDINITVVFHVQGNTFWQVKRHSDRKYGVAFMVRDTSRITVKSVDVDEGERRTNSRRTYSDLIGTEYTCFDLLLHYCKLFGLIFKVDNVTGEINILLRDNYYSSDRVLYWTSQIDRSKELIIEPLGFNFQKGVFKYNDIDTKYEKIYTDSTGISYGSFEVDTGYKIDDSEYNYLEGTIFNNCVVASDYSQYYAGRSSIALRDNKQLPHLQDEDGKRIDSSGFVLLFRGENQVLSKPTRFTDDTDAMKNDGLICWNNSILYGGFTRNISGYYRTIKGDDDDVYSLNFGTPSTVYSDSETLQTDNSGIYAKYWRSYINDRLDRNCKLLTCYVYLQPSDVNTDLLASFIYISGSLWVIDEVSGFNPVSEQPTKVKLIKVRDVNNYLNHNNLSDKFIVSFEGEEIFNNQKGNYPSLIVVEDSVNSVELDISSSVMWSASSNMDIIPITSSEPETSLTLTFADDQQNAFVRFMYNGNSITIRFERKKLYTVTASAINGGSVLINGNPSPIKIEAGKNANFSASGAELIYWEIDGEKYYSDIVTLPVNKDLSASAMFAGSGQIKLYCDDSNTTVSGIQKIENFFLLNIGQSYNFSNNRPDFSGFLFSSESEYKQQGSKTITDDDSKLSVYYNRVLLNMTVENKSDSENFTGEYIFIGGSILNFDVDPLQTVKAVQDVDVNSTIRIEKAPYHYPTFNIESFPGPGVYDLGVTGNIVGWPGDLEEDVVAIGGTTITKMVYSPIPFTLQSDLNITPKQGSGNTNISIPLTGTGGAVTQKIGDFEYILTLNQTATKPVGWNGTGLIVIQSYVAASATSATATFYHNNLPLILSQGITKGANVTESDGSVRSIMTASFSANSGSERQLTFTVTVNGTAYLWTITQAGTSSQVPSSYWGQTVSGGKVEGSMINVDGIRPSINATYTIGTPGLYYRNGYITYLNTNGIFSGTAGYYIESSKGNALTTIRDASNNICCITRRLYVGAYSSDTQVSGVFNNFDPIPDFYASYIACVSVIQSSDKNRKDIINKIDCVDISKIGVYKFTYKEDKQKKIRLGVIAQEVKEIIPEAVTGEDGNLMVDYSMITSALLVKIKELEERIHILESSK